MALNFTKVIIFSFIFAHPIPLAQIDAMRKILIAAALMLFPAVLNAQRIVTNDQADDHYSDEVGFFQKAYRDKSDPRFMFRDGKFEFGVGGRVQTSLFYDFAGAVDDQGFKTYMISVPTDDTPNYGMAINGSNIYFKARAQLGKHKLLAYTKIGINSSEMAKFSQAYISFDGFTMGKTYTFFSDLEAGPRSIDDAGVNAEIDKTHPLIGYTWRINKRMMLGAAIEKAEFNLDPYAEYGIDSDYQSLPDIAMRFKYKADKWHVQVAGLIRNLAYWVYTPPKVLDIDGETRHVFAWGAALSGNWTPVQRFRFSAQTFVGSGVSSYIRDFSDAAMSVEMFEKLSGGYHLLNTRFAAGGFVSGQVRWNESLTSNFTGGYAWVDRGNDTYCGNNLRNTLYASANFMYDISNYCYMGLEYIHGRSENYKEEGASDFVGRANRLLFVFSYSF